MSGDSQLALTRVPAELRDEGRWRLPSSLRSLLEEIEERTARLLTRTNEYGYDPFGFDPEYARGMIALMGLMHRHWFRVETRGIDRIPESRVLLIGNHAGNILMSR